MHTPTLCSLRTRRPLALRALAGRRLGRALAGAAAVALLAGCASTEPYAQLDGHRQRIAEMNTFDVLIISVDGRHVIQRGRDPVVIDPGLRRIVVQGPPAPGFGYGEQRALELKVEPCVRYWLEARKSSRLLQDFEPAVNYSEPIAGCAPAGRSRP